MKNHVSKQSRFARRAALICLAAVLVAGLGPAVSAQEPDEPPRVEILIPPGTQGPLWPPAEMVDRDGNYVVVGNLLAEHLPDTYPGAVFPALGAALVSNATVPPLNADGVEDFSDLTRNLTTPYDIIRPLDLSPGSPDLDIVLWASSFGPPEGDFGGGPRIPQAGESEYNLNSFAVTCPGLFPSESQRFVYTRPSYPLHRVPIWGFQGDQVEYEPNTGEPFVPSTFTGVGCPGQGCEGENEFDTRQLRRPVTLGEYLQASGRLQITLTNFDEDQNAYTAARFAFKFTNLLPKAVYTIWTIRTNNVTPVYPPSLSDPLTIPNQFVTDRDGNAEFVTKVMNPFPDPMTDPNGARITGVAIDYHSDYQTWGGCFARFGGGVDVHVHLSTFFTGSFELTDLITVER